MGHRDGKQYYIMAVIVPILPVKHQMLILEQVEPQFPQVEGMQTVNQGNLNSVNFRVVVFVKFTKSTVI